MSEMLVAHAFVWPEGEPPSNAVVYDLSVDAQCRDFIEELRLFVSEADPIFADEGKPWAHVEIKPMPKGYIDTLPEHQGW